MAVENEPDERLTKKALPAPLRAAIEAVFSGGLEGVALVGGTALSGYYACHRRSDDMDLFTKDSIAHDMAVRRVKELPRTSISEERRSPTYYHALAESGGHTFTIDVVLDPNLFRVGTVHITPKRVGVISLQTLRMMKTATLVSRCSEKDLYDLVWLSKRFGNVTVEEWVTLGHQIDGGVTPESILLSLAGVTPRIAACGFAQSFGVPSEEVLKLIMEFRSSLIKTFQAHLEKAPIDREISQLIKKLKH